MASLNEAPSSDGEDNAKKAYSVKEAVGIAKSALEKITLRVVGEVSYTSKGGYTAFYFNLEEKGQRQRDNAVLKCMMWSDRYKAGYQIHVGEKVEVIGRFSVYPPKGDLQFTVFNISPAGEGILRKQVAELANRLLKEGLMDPARKRKIPRFPRRVGLVTSPNGKAVHDVLRTMRRRYPIAEVVFAGTQVEGKDAPAGMMTALDACAQAGCDVILLVRGGGSYEDLMPFNDESLARAVAACPVPVVTGIGHEPDNSICDMVADVRASTPTAAAETVTPDGAKIIAHLENRAQAMNATMRHLLDSEASRLDLLANRTIFTEPQTLFSIDAITLDRAQDVLCRTLPERLGRDAETVDHLTVRLGVAGGRIGSAERSDLGHIEQRLQASIPHNLQADVTAVAEADRNLRRLGAALVSRQQAGVSSLQQRLAASLQGAGGIERRELKSAAQRMRQVGSTMLSPFERQCAVKAGQLDSLSPLSVLARGYAMATDRDGSVITDSAQAHVGDAITVRLSRGALACTVDSTIGPTEEERA
jgi:exodeoxyribonuclease VII large subunit